MRRGEVWWADLPKPIGRRPVLILSRDIAVRVRDYITIAEVATTIRHIAVEVPLHCEDGLSKECVVNLDALNTVAKVYLKEKITTLSATKLEAVEKALKFALDLD